VGSIPAQPTNKINDLGSIQVVVGVIWGILDIPQKAPKE
jgi:hypothetical protein